MFLRAEPQFVSFAPIDLKNTYLYVRDGFSNGSTSPTTSAVEPIGETTIALANCNLNVPDGASVVFGNEIDEEYTVSSATRTGGTDTKFNLDQGTAADKVYTLTFKGQTTEPLAFDAAVATIEAALEALCNIAVGDLTLTDNTGDIDIEFGGTWAGKVLTLTDLTLQDYTTINDMALTITTPGVVPTATTAMVITPGLLTATTIDGVVTFKGRKIEVVVGEGNMTYKETYNREYRRNRGILNTVRNENQEPLELTFDLEWEYISSACGTAPVPTIEEAFKQTGAASDWISTSSDTCEPYCCDIEIWNIPSCTVAGANEKIIFEQFRVESLDHNAADSQIAASGKCNIVAPTTRRYSS
jgi:hypothetical protein